MLFYGRLLATNAIGDVWQEGDIFFINLREKRITLSLPANQLHQLLDLLIAAEKTARMPERRHDEIRRLQVSRARIAERLEQAKARGKDDTE